MNDGKYGTQCDTQTFTQEYSEVSLNEVSLDLRLYDIAKCDKNWYLQVNYKVVVSRQFHF